MENILEIKNLNVEYETRGEIAEGKRVFAVNNLSLDVKKGEIFSIAGESGCGKSTLLKAILKLVETKSGDIIFNDPKIVITSDKLSKKDLKNYRTKVQMVFQNPYASLNPKMKIYDILKEPLIINKKQLSKQEMDKKIFETIAKVGLEESVLELYPHEFSGGQRQRIAIARALVLDPEFILADEPVSALDVSIQGQIINLLNDLKEKLNLTFLFISHDLNVIKYLSDRVAIMYLGEIVEQGETYEIFNNPKHPYTKALLSANPSNKGEKIILSGDLPSPSNLPSGCKFHTRCPKVMVCCSVDEPKKVEFSQSHFACCHLYK